LELKQLCWANFVMLIVLIFVIGLLPAVLSLVVYFYGLQRLQQRLRYAAQSSAYSMSTGRFRAMADRPYNPDEHYVDGMGLVIGDITCQLNARSPFLRCTANPYGPCKDCQEYEGRDYA
jgi:hypothetical protein